MANMSDRRIINHSAEVHVITRDQAASPSQALRGKVR